MDSSDDEEMDLTGDEAEKATGEPSDEDEENSDLDEEEIWKVRLNSLCFSATQSRLSLGNASQHAQSCGRRR